MSVGNIIDGRPTMTKEATELERCSICDEPTGRAGIGEDSLTVDGVNPLCEEHYDEATRADLSKDALKERFKVGFYDKDEQAYHAILALIDAQGEQPQPEVGEELFTALDVAMHILKNQGTLIIPGEGLYDFGSKKGKKYLENITNDLEQIKQLLQSRPERIQPVRVSEEWISDFLRNMPVYDAQPRKDYTIKKFKELGYEQTQPVRVSMKWIKEQYNEQFEMNVIWSGAIDFVVHILKELGIVVTETAEEEGNDSD